MSRGPEEAVYSDAYHRRDVGIFSQSSLRFPFLRFRPLSGIPVRSAGVPAWSAGIPAVPAGIPAVTAGATVKPLVLWGVAHLEKAAGFAEILQGLA